MWDANISYSAHTIPYHLHTKVKIQLGIKENSRIRRKLNFPPNFVANASNSLTMNFIKKSTLILACCMILPLGFSQDLVSMKHALKVEMGLPSAQTNRAYKEFIQGVAYGHVNYQYRMFGNDKWSPVFGLGISANYMDVANYKINGLNQGGLTSYGGNAKLGVEIIHDENKIVDYHIKLGYLNMLSINRQTNQNIQKRATFADFFLEPGVNFTLMLDERQGVSFNLSYTIRNIRFNETHLMITELPGFVGANLNGRTGHINFGFGYTLYIQKPKNNID